MQSSKVNTVHPADDSIRVKKEITVVSSGIHHSKTHTHESGRPLSSNTNRPPQATGQIGSQLNKNSRAIRSAEPSTLPHESREMPKDTAGRLDENREAMRHLSEFLMREPPSGDNYMSKESDDDMKSIKSTRRSISKAFKGKSKRQPKIQKLMRLPDSAVSSRTRSGTRHIAIYIPSEYDPLKGTECAQSQLEIGTSEDVTTRILHPVQGYRSSPAGYLEVVEEGSEQRPDIYLGPEAFQPMNAFYNAIELQQLIRSGSIRSQSLRNQSLRGQSFRNNHNAGSRHGLSDVETKPSTQDGVSQQQPATVITMPDGEKHVDPRLMRDLANTSTATFRSSPRFSIPNRGLSTPKANSGLQQEHAETSQASNKTTEEYRNANPTDSMGTTTLKSPTSVIGMPEKARSYTVTPKLISPDPPARLRGLDVPRPTTTLPRQNYTTKRNSNAGTANLVRNDSQKPFEVPQSRQQQVKARKSRDILLYQNKNAPTNNVRTSVRAQKAKEKSFSTWAEEKDHILAVPFVSKANRNKELQSIKDNLSQVTTEGSMEATAAAKLSTRPNEISESNSLPPEAPKEEKRDLYGQIKKASPSGESANRKIVAKEEKSGRASGLSGIMIVADIPGCTGTINTPDHAPTPSLAEEGNVFRKAPSKSSARHGQENALTPLPAGTSFVGPESDSPPVQIARPQSLHLTPSNDHLNPLEARRQDRRSLHNITIGEKEAEIERRISRLENDNSIMRQALSSIAESTRQLSKFYQSPLATSADEGSHQD